MRKKKKDPLLELLGYDSEQDLVAADDVLKDIMNKIMDGDLMTIVAVSGLKTLSKTDVQKLSGIVKGHASGYVRHFFDKSTFTIDDVEEDADETRAAIHLIGETVSAEELCGSALTVLAQNESTLQLHSGELDMRKIGLAMDLVDKQIAALRPAPVQGVVHMEKQGGQWKLMDSDALSRIMIRGSLLELEQAVKAYFDNKSQGET